MRPHRLAGLPVLICALFAAAAPARAQVLYGRVVDADDGSPVSAATVAAMDAGGGSIASVITGADGRYELALPRAASVRLRVGRVGYVTGLAPAVAVGEGERMGVDLRIRPEALAMEQVEVESRVVPNFHDPRARGFYDRMDRGRGRYISPERVQALNATHTSDLLRTLPGLAFSRGVSSAGMRFGSGTRRCVPQLYIDGYPFRPYPGWQLDDHVRADDVWAVEVYRRSSDIPPDLPRDGNSACGIVVIWRKGA